MGDTEGAREILNEIIGEADQEGQAKAKALLDGIDD
jgi:FimV-like protein